MFDWNMNVGTSGATVYAKNAAYASVTWAWKYMQLAVNNSVLSERTHASSFMFTYATPPSTSNTYGANTDGDYVITACCRSNIDGEPVHIQMGPSAAGVYYICAKGVGAYDGCYAWMQFEIYGSGGSPSGLYSLSNMQSDARLLGYDETL